MRHAARIPGRRRVRYPELPVAALPEGPRRPLGRSQMAVMLPYRNTPLAESPRTMIKCCARLWKLPSRQFAPLPAGCRGATLHTAHRLRPHGNRAPVGADRRISLPFARHGWAKCHESDIHRCFRYFRLLAEPLQGGYWRYVAPGVSIVKKPPCVNCCEVSHAAAPPTDPQ